MTAKDIRQKIADIRLESIGPDMKKRQEITEQLKELKCEYARLLSLENEESKKRRK